MKRSRGRGRRPQNNHNHSHNHNRAFDSAGPDVKIRGTAAHVYEKYLQLARDANSAGDRIQAENYLQHAEHYYRILMAAQAHQAGQQGFNNPNPQQGVGQEQRPNGGEAYPQEPVPNGPSFTMSDEGDDGDEGEEAA